MIYLFDALLVKALLPSGFSTDMNIFYSVTDTDIRSAAHL